ncbi:hypothetical protein HF295_03570 [Hujiaoplasma nucleasis]|uniref:Uncharacterized protein n=1 Tax=Hujiaoplasma nucleasis TaxID=2725268 RepID=A0A7L6N154_9MOLU|nr:hypothetical protein [Hujiaoplasma nucleasis]QLY39986.1 hypothetical protein HF295_03570 [Hujiaoplasma nucleasis]
MKKLMLLIITGIIVFSFNGCETNNYNQFNEKLESIVVEESGYIFFTSNKIIDEEDEYDLMIILKAVF